MAPGGPLILGFDTAGPWCCAALVAGGRVLAEAQEEIATGQAERLIPMLGAVLAAGGAGWRDLAAVGVGTGPGNFTGVRIAVAAARGIATGLGVQAIGVGLLEARAEGLARPLAVVEDARRGEVYLQSFGTGADEGPLLLDPSDIAPALGDLPLAGGAAAAVAALTGAVVLAPALPLAVAIARIAAQRLGAPQPRPAPLYLRAPDAQPRASAP
jgi:tRNA threonylcarbamoyl adenosine modification protein YeaZ